MILLGFAIFVSGRVFADSKLPDGSSRIIGVFKRDWQKNGHLVIDPGITIGMVGPDETLSPIMADVNKGSYCKIDSQSVWIPDTGKIADTDQELQQAIADFGASHGAKPGDHLEADLSDWNAIGFNGSDEAGRCPVVNEILEQTITVYDGD